MTPEEMSIEEALARLKNGDLYDRKGNLTKAGYQALERLEGVDLNIRPEPVEPMKPEEKTARIEKDIDSLEFRIKRLEKTIEHMLRGVRVEIKEATGHGLTEEEILFLRDQLNSIRDDLYGEENVHFPLPEENGTPVATSKFEDAIRDKLWGKGPEETEEK